MTSEKYLIHSLYDVEKTNQIFRVYRRNSTYFSMTHSEKSLEKSLNQNFMLIPDKNIDILISRDEEALYIWKVQPRVLQVDLTNP